MSNTMQHSFGRILSGLVSFSRPIGRRRPNKRLKLAGGDRFRGSGVLCPCRGPLYLTDMAVAPAWQGKGVGRVCMDQAIRLAETWPGDAIRLDAYGAPAGAAAFYFKCGFVNRGRVTYRGTPLVYYELLLSRAKQVRPNKRLKLTGARK